MRKIEILYPEVGNLFGDLFNMNYLRQCLPDAEYIETHLNEMPHFAQEDVDMIYIGPLPEYAQEIAVEKLLPLKERLEEVIDRGTVILATGNAQEIFGTYIENDDGSKIQCLGIFDAYAKRKMMDRFNTPFSGTMKDGDETIRIVGFKSQFTQMYGDNGDGYVFDVEKGCGINPESKKEGLRRKNFIGTNVLGPIMIMNPPFTRYIMKLLGEEQPKVAFEEDAEVCYRIRLDEFEKMNVEV